MKVQITSKTDTEIEFILEDSNPQFANALRRIMISEIPVLAIEDVDFYHNDSVLYNEVIASRLALIPLVFDPDKFHFPREKHDEGKFCSMCEVVFVINKKGPGMIYAKDMKSSNEDVKPLYPDTPIVELFNDQKLKLEAYAHLGLGKDHAKFQAANASYKYVNNDKTKFNFKVESISGLKPEEIVTKAVEILKEKVKEFDKQFKKI